MDRPTPAQVLAEIALPALDVLTRPGEVTSIRAWDEGSDVKVEVQCGADRFVVYAWTAGVEPHTSWLGNFASQLQDFIAESSFAWGTLREYPAEWGGR